MSRAEDLHNRAQIVKELVDDLAAEVAKLPTSVAFGTIQTKVIATKALDEMLDAQVRLADAIRLLHTKIG